MGVLQRIFQSALRCERQVLLSVRHASNFQPSQHDALQRSNFILNTLAHTHFVKTSRSDVSSAPTQISNSWMEKRIFPILPLNPIGGLSRLKLPSSENKVTFEMPTCKISLDNIQINQKIVEIKTPQHGEIVEQWAHRMLVIRHRKMKKHQLRKFRKKFRVKLMTIKKRRYILKETMFLSGLEEEMKQAEAFDAKQFTLDKIRRAYEPVPEKPKLIRPLPWEFQPHFYNSQKNKPK